jgi:hypothetical protein
LQGNVPALCIANFPEVIPKIKLPYIPFKMLGANMLANPKKPRFKMLK